MTTSYEERLRSALAPQNREEHAVIDYIVTVAPSQLSTIVELVERRTRTAARAGRMHVAHLALDHWLPEPVAPPDAYDVMESYAAGADPAAGTVPEAHEDPAAAIGLAYDRGWTEAVAYCREQQERGLDPELWSIEPPR